MASSLSLPAPTRSVPAAPVSSTRAAAPAKKSPPKTTTTVPSYEERCNTATAMAKLTPEQRKGKKLFVPRSLADFGAGGAFPEIHVAQYPRHMGNPHLKQKTSSGAKTVAGAQLTSTALVNVEVDEHGEVSYDAIVKSGTNADKIVYSKHSDLKGGPADPGSIALPSVEQEEETKRRTQQALQALVSKQTALDKPSGSAMQNAATSHNMEEKTQFIKYTPREDAPGYNKEAAPQRVIQMVPAQVDPMMPPKHKHIKAPRGPAEDPVPVLHAPPTKLSKEERDAWNVPACISNWKNTRGYTIPLDKRLAADGRHLQSAPTVNPNFATLAESLHVAERQARQEVRMRAQVQKELALSQKEKREEDLRALANQARMERSGGATAVASRVVPEEDIDHGDDDSEAPNIQETDEDVAARQRERLRMERKRERERELRLEHASAEVKKQRLEADRDVSEKIALGVHTGHGGIGGEVDSRLYNQSAGMDSGFGRDDEYNAYTKPMFDRQGVASSSIYRPTRGETSYNAEEQYDKLVESATSKFHPDKGFAGAEGGGAANSAGPRSAPVQFEKDRNN